MMRRLLISALLFAVALGWVAAQAPIYYESTPTLVWDAVTTDSDGMPFLTGDIVEYEVYLWDAAGGDVTVQPVSDLTWHGVTGATQLLLSFPYRTEWATAVRVRHTDGGGNVSHSDLAYSVVQGDTLYGPFAYVPQLIWLPSKPGGLRDSGM